MRKNPEKISPRKLVPTGDRTRARCVTWTHATTWPTAVDVGEGIEGGGTLAAPATSFLRDLIKYMTANACFNPLVVTQEVRASPLHFKHL